MNGLRKLCGSYGGKNGTINGKEVCIQRRGKRALEGKDRWPRGSQKGKKFRRGKEIAA